MSIEANTGIRVVLDPTQRAKHVRYLLELDGLDHLIEDPKAAYCPVSLTSTPEELKPIISQRQQLLLGILTRAGIKGYDPASAPFSPDLNLSHQPSRIYMEDSSKIASARFFVGHHLIPSSGYGTELEIAKNLNRIAVNLMDVNHRITRMQPHRMINLQYTHFLDQASTFEEVFLMLQEFQPGIGFNDGIPVLLGFDNHGNVVDLAHEVYRTFPSLRYEYNGEVPAIGLGVKPNLERASSYWKEFNDFYGLSH